MRVVSHSELLVEQFVFVNEDGIPSWSQHQKCKRGTYFLVSWVNVYVSKPSNWCHEILVTAPKMQEGILYKFIFMFMSVLQSSTELACVGCIYSVLCTSHCVVFYNVPPLMEQVLGKVLLTSWEIS